MLNFLCTGIGRGLGPLLTGWLYDVHGPCIPAWQIQLAALLVATFLIFALKRGARRGDA